MQVGNLVKAAAGGASDMRSCSVLYSTKESLPLQPEDIMQLFAAYLDLLDHIMILCFRCAYVMKSTKYK